MSMHIVRIFTTLGLLVFGGNDQEGNAFKMIGYGRVSRENSFRQEGRKGGGLFDPIDKTDLTAALSVASQIVQQFICSSR